MVSSVFERTYVAKTEIEIERSGDGRTVTAYAAVFDQDAEIVDQFGHYMERIDRAAFDRTLGMKPADKIKVFYNHGYDLTGKPNMVGSVPIGTPIEVKTDSRGLLTVTRYNDSPLAEQVLSAIRDGQITGQSFRGAVYKSKNVRSRGASLKTVIRTELGLTEYGPTHSPAYAGAGMVAIRSQDDLAEMIRTMIAEYGITSPDPDAYLTTPFGPGQQSEDPVSYHSRKTVATRNAMLLRAKFLGAIEREAPQEH